MKVFYYLLLNSRRTLGDVLYFQALSCPLRYFKTNTLFFRLPVTFGFQQRYTVINVCLLLAIKQNLNDRNAFRLHTLYVLLILTKYSYLENVSNPVLICFSACIVVRSSMASIHFPGLHHHPAGDATGKEGHVWVPFRAVNQLEVVVKYKKFHTWNLPLLYMSLNYFSKLVFLQKKINNIKHLCIRQK